MARLGYPSPSPQGKIGHRRSVLWVSPDRVCRGEALEVMYESASTDCGYGGGANRGVVGPVFFLFLLTRGWFGGGGGAVAGGGVGGAQPARRGRHGVPPVLSPD